MGKSINNDAKGIIMGRNDFLKNQIYLSELKEKLNEAMLRLSNGNSRIKEVHGLTDSDIRQMEYNLKYLFKSIINDKNIEYSAYKLLVATEKIRGRTNMFRNIAFDLDKMEQSRGMKDVTFIFIILHFYASHFDFTINFLKPIAKAIQKFHNYKVKNEILKVEKSWQVLEVFRRFRPTFYWYLTRFLDRDLRNAVAHDNYRIHSNKVYYEKSVIINHKKYPKEGYINRDKLLIKSLFFGKFINQLQTQEYEINITILDVAFRQKMTKKQSILYAHNFRL